MRPIGTYVTTPAIPPTLSALSTLARDLRFTFREDLRKVFEVLDAEAWAKAAGNPVRFLHLVEPARLQLAST
ncbi:MAG: DUF3417 domain-containing protein, partial [Acidobacteria bacterium]|nr:DUF3417 domain-containing protein [Acidobacteriota bacterium]